MTVEKEKKEKKLTRVNLLRPRGVGVNRWIVRPTINLAALEIRSKERKGVNTREDDATRRRRFSIARSALVFFSVFFFLFLLFSSQLCWSSCSTFHDAARPRLSVRLALVLIFSTIRKHGRVISRRWLCGRRSVERVKGRERERGRMRVKERMRERERAGKQKAKRIWIHYVRRVFAREECLHTR